MKNNTWKSCVFSEKFVNFACRTCRMCMVNKQEMLISTKSPIGSCVECHNRKQLLNMCHIGAINVQFKTENYMK